MAPPRIKPGDSITLRNTTGTVPATVAEVLDDGLADLGGFDDDNARWMAVEHLLTKLRVAGYLVAERTVEPAATWSFRDDGAWRIARRSIVQDGRKAVAELRIVPRMSDPFPSPTWSMDVGDVPAGGLPMTVLQRIRQRDHFDADTDEVIARAFGGGERSETSVNRARVAAAYDLVDRIVGRKHSVYVGEALGFGARAVTNIVDDCRHSAGYLTGGGQGRGGGRATSLALRVLTESEYREVERKVIKCLSNAERSALRTWQATKKDVPSTRRSTSRRARSATESESESHTQHPGLTRPWPAVVASRVAKTTDQDGGTK